MTAFSPLGSKKEKKMLFSMQNLKKTLNLNKKNLNKNKNKKMVNLQSYKKQTVSQNSQSSNDINHNCKKAVDKKVDIVKYTFDKQQEGTAEIFKKMRDAISTTSDKK